MNRSTSLAYDAVGNLSGFTRAGQNWSYGYDQLGRRTSASDPDTGTTTYTYDTSSNLTTTTSNGRLVTSTFDSYSRPLQTFDGDAASGTLLNSTAYVNATPNLGAVASASSFDSGVEYKAATTSWDGFGRALNSVFTVPSGGLAPAELAGSFTNNFTYRAGGGIKTTNYAFNNTGGVPDETVTPTVTSLGLPASLSVTAAAPGSPQASVITSTGFDATGLPASRTWAAGASGVALGRAYGFDPVRRIPTSITTGTGTGAGAVSTPVVAETISYDGLARSASITDAVTGSANQTRCFAYTGYSELANAWTQAAPACPAAAPAATSVTWNTGAGSNPFWASWSFDNDTGHVTDRVDGYAANVATPVNTRFVYEDTDHPNAVSGTLATGGEVGGPEPFMITGYQYDADGQRSSRADLGGAPDTEAITWTALHQPASITTPGGDTRFVHNPDGTRLIRSTPTATTVYLGDTELTVNTTTRAVTARRSYSLGGAQVAFRDTSTGSANLVFTASDTQGSASLQVDPASFTTTTGWVAASYTPYGTQRLQTAGAQTWVGDRDWLNKPADASTGLTQTDQRLYDPGLQQFISPDPLLTPANPNPYTYAANNPITGADPSGLYCTNYVESNCGENGLGGPQPDLSKPGRYPSRNQVAHNVYMCGDPYGCGGGSVDSIGHATLSGGYGPHAATLIEHQLSAHPDWRGPDRFDWSFLAKAGIAVAAVAATVAVCAVTAVVGCVIAGIAIGAAAGAADYGAGVGFGEHDYNGADLAKSAGIGALLGAIPGAGKLFGKALGGLAGRAAAEGLEGGGARALTATEQAAVDYGTSSAKLDHIFVPKHNLDPLVRQLGSREAVVDTIVRNLGGPLPASGSFEVPSQVGNQIVIVRGAVVEGVPKIGTAFTP